MSAKKTFIIHSLKLLSDAIKLEKVLKRPCYIPGRDAAQFDGEQTIIAANLEALKQSEDDVYIVWDGNSYGTLFDMGSAYALGKTLHFSQIGPGEHWQEWFRLMLHTTIKHENGMTNNRMSKNDNII